MWHTGVFLFFFDVFVFGVDRVLSKIMVLSSRLKFVSSSSPRCFFSELPMGHDKCSTEVYRAGSREIFRPSQVYATKRALPHTSCSVFFIITSEVRLEASSDPAARELSPAYRYGSVHKTTQNCSTSSMCVESNQQQTWWNSCGSPSCFSLSFVSVELQTRLPTINITLTYTLASIEAFGFIWSYSRIIHTFVHLSTYCYNTA